MIKTKEFSLPLDCDKCMLADLCSKKKDSENLIKDIRTAIETHPYTPLNIQIKCRFFKEERDEL